MVLRVLDSVPCDSSSRDLISNELLLSMSVRPSVRPPVHLMSGRYRFDFNLSCLLPVQRRSRRLGSWAGQAPQAGSLLKLNGIVAVLPFQSRCLADPSPAGRTNLLDTCRRPPTQSCRRCTRGKIKVALFTISHLHRRLLLL